MHSSLKGLLGIAMLNLEKIFFRIFSFVAELYKNVNNIWNTRWQIWLAEVWSHDNKYIKFILQWYMHISKLFIRNNYNRTTPCIQNIENKSSVTKPIVNHKCIPNIKNRLLVTKQRPQFTHAIICWRLMI